MAAQSRQLRELLDKWGLAISALGGIVTGVAGLLMGLDATGLNGAVYLVAAGWPSGW